MNGYGLREKHLTKLDNSLALIRLSRERERSAAVGSPPYPLLRRWILSKMCGCTVRILAKNSFELDAESIVTAR